MRNCKKGIVSILPILIASGFIVLGIIITLSRVNLVLLVESTKLKSNPVLEQSITKNVTSTLPKPAVTRVSTPSTTKPRIVQNPTVTTKTSQNPAIIADYTTREIKQYGYTIFVGTMSDTPQYNFDQYLDQIIPYLIAIKFPRALIEDSAFIILVGNIKGKTVSVGQSVYNLSTIINSMESQAYGGMFSSISNNNKLIIFNLTDLQSGFYAVLTHELGHVIYSVMTKSEKDEWSKLRGEPVRTEPYRNWTDWELSRNEDFAEIFKYLYGQNKNADIHWEIHTAYKTRPCRSYYTPEELDQLLMNPAQWAKVMLDYPPCYKSEPLDDSTQAFIKSVLGRLL
jgi:hypothetical protein